MFCPKCGQEQVTEVPNFCSRCGFQLTEVTSLLARGGAPGQTQQNKPPRDKVRRYGLRLLMAALAFFVLAMFSVATEGDAGISIFGFLTFASFVIGSCVLIYSWIKGRMRRRSDSAPLGQTSRVEAPQIGALPPAYAPPIALPRARFEPGALAQCPSVTEHTTRQLEHESSQESERTRLARMSTGNIVPGARWLGSTTFHFLPEAPTGRRLTLRISRPRTAVRWRSAKAVYQTP